MRLTGQNSTLNSTKRAASSARKKQRVYITPTECGIGFVDQGTWAANSSKGKEECDKVRNEEPTVKKQARITSKGQITVPHEIRRALGVQAGDKLLFEKDSGGVRVRPVRTKSPFEKYRGIGSPGIPRGRKAVMRWVRSLRGR